MMARKGNGHPPQSVTFTVPFASPSQNQLDRKYRNPHARKRLRESWEQVIRLLPEYHSREWLKAMAKLKKRMEVRFTIQHKKLYDKANAYGGTKPCVDALVNVGYLYDDSIEFCELIVEQDKINADSTRIEIREAQS